MKTYTVDLGGQNLELLYRIQDREAVEALFPRADGTPGNMPTMVQEHCMTGRGAFAVQAGLLWGGLRHLPDWTLARVKEEFGKLVTSGVAGSIRNVNTAILQASVASGVLGFVPDEDDEGKAQPPAA